MKNYLVPVDFSSNAQRALSAARILAKSTGVHLYVLHAHQPYIPDIALGAPGIPLPEDFEEAFRNDLQQYVDDLIADGFSAEGIWEQGIVADVVRGKIEELKPELVIIGRTGTGGFVDRLFGTAASDIVKLSKVPVLVIPPQAHPESFKEIVYATQLEHEERHVIGKVLELSRQLSGRVTFLKINSLTQPNIQDDNQFIHDITAEFGLPESEFMIEDAGSVLGGIEQYAKELNADLLVVATRSRGILEQLFVDPSITAKLIVRTSLPLLVYHLEE